MRPALAAPERAALRIGTEYESSLDPDVRRRGAHYTPYPVAASVVELALARSDSRRPLVLDPTCGGGVFLIAALDALVARGVAPVDALGCVRGVDIDPGAVDATRRSVQAWAAEHDTSDAASPSEDCAARGDVAAASWSPAAHADVVVGNPPFRARLRRETATDEGRDAVMVSEGVAGAYTDLAVLIWHASRSWTRPGGVVAMILPRSVLAARDAEGARRSALEGSILTDVWIPDHDVFGGADVRVAVPVLVGVGSGESVQVWVGDVPEPGPTVDNSELRSGSWACLAAAALGVPQVQGGGAPLRSVARATAGFRDLFYAVSEVVRDGVGGPGVDRVATTAMVDVGAVTWGGTSVRIGGRRWTNPVVAHDDLAASSGAASTWMGRQRTPKVLVATQTKVIEAGPDLTGDLLPLTPLISVVPERCSVWELVAALSAPPATAWALRTAAGTAMSADALKLSASQVLDLPLPVDEDAWRRAAERLSRDAQVDDVADDLTAAWGADDVVTRWWRGRAEPSMRRVSRSE